MESTTSLERVCEIELVNVNINIRFDKINFAYPSRPDIPVLHNLTLVARAGQTTALVGTSGCGKY